MSAGSLEVRLIGELTLVTPDGERHLPRGRNVRAVLVFLLAEGVETVSRERLASLIWPDAERTRRLASLRVCLSQLEKYLSSLLPGRYLRRDARAVGLHPEAPLSSDWDALRREFDRPAGHGTSAPGREPLADIEAPSDLYEEWLEPAREWMRVAQLDLLEREARAALMDGSPARARRMAERTLAADPLNESGHRLLAEVLSAGAATTAAEAQLSGCCRLLRDHLAVPAAPETRAALVDLTAGDPAGGMVLAPPEPRDPASWFPVTQRRKLDHLFAIFDEDGDGILTWESFAAKVDALRDPFRVGRGDARLVALERAFAADWRQLSRFARDDAFSAVDRAGWFRYMWWTQQCLGEMDPNDEVPPTGNQAGPALFRLADRNGDGRKTRREFCGWLGAWTRHLGVDPERAFRALNGRREEIDIQRALGAGARFKFSALPADGDALFGLLD